MPSPGYPTSRKRNSGHSFTLFAGPGPAIHDASDVGELELADPCHVLGSAVLEAGYANECTRETSDLSAPGGRGFRGAGLASALRTSGSSRAPGMA